MPADFRKKVYDLCSTIPRGRVTTYGEIARALHTRAFRAVGQALRVNPYAPEVPCHRVVASDGTLVGFQGTTAGEALEKKQRLLEEEGITFSGKRIQYFNSVFFRF